MANVTRTVLVALLLTILTGCATIVTHPPMQLAPNQHPKPKAIDSPLPYYTIKP